MDRFKHAMTHHVGAGGLQCKCCNKFVNQHKPMLRQLARQKLKRYLKGKDYVHE